jgi:hypothetical protein
MRASQKSKILGLTGLVVALAMLAVAAVGAASASAAPTYKICAKVEAGELSKWEAGCTKEKAGGGYIKVTAPWVHIAGEKWCAPVVDAEPSSFSNASCTTAGTGYVKVDSKFANPLAFTSTSGVKKLITTVPLIGQVVVECKKDTNKGAITGPTTDEVTIEFFECKLVAPAGGACHSLKPLGGAGVIKTNPLVSKLSLLQAEPKIVGVDLSATEFSEFECVGPFGEKLTVKVTGSVIGVITPLATMTTTFALKFKCVGEPKKQEWTKDLNEPTDVLMASVNGGTAKEACEEEVTNDVLTTNEPVEIQN